MSTVRILTRNIFSNWANLAVSIGIGFFMMPFLISQLGDALYGIWILIVSIVGYGNLLDFGVRTSIVKYVSQHHAIDDQDRLNSLFTTTLTVYMIIGILVLCSVAGATLFLPNLFQIPQELVDEARWVLLIIGVNLALKFPSGVFEGFLAGLQRYELANGIAIGFNLLRTVLVVLLLINGRKLLALAAVGLGIDFLMSAVMAVVCLRLLPWLSFSRRYLSRVVLRQIYTYGMWSATIAVASRVLYESDSILISIFLPTMAVTHFAVANNLIRYLRQLASGFGWVFNPAASNLEARNQEERLERLLIYGTRFAFAIVLPIAVLIGLVGREFLTLWVGSQYAGESGTVLIILALSQVFAMAQFPAGSVLFGLNRHCYLAAILVCEAILKVALSLILLPFYGIVGVAVGTAIPELIASLIMIPILITRITNIRLSQYFQLVFLRPFASVLPIIALVFVLKAAVLPTSWAVLIAEVAAGLIVYAVSFLSLCLDSSHRIIISHIIKHSFQRVTK